MMYSRYNNNNNNNNNNYYYYYYYYYQVIHLLLNLYICGRILLLLPYVLVLYCCVLLQLPHLVAVSQVIRRRFLSSSYLFLFRHMSFNTIMKKANSQNISDFFWKSDVRISVQVRISLLKSKIVISQGTNDNFKANSQNILDLTQRFESRSRLEFFS